MSMLLRNLVSSAGLVLTLAGTATAAIDGVVIKRDGAIVAAASAGVASGELSVPPGEAGTFDVFFTDGGVEVQPPSPPHVLTATIADPLVAGAVVNGYQVEVAGLADGMTEVVLRLADGGTPLYESPAFEVHVEPAHAEAEGLVLRQNGAVVASVWQGAVTGALEVHHMEPSDTLFVTFLDADSIEFTPEPPEFTFYSEVADPALLQVDTAGDWAFTLLGLEEGQSSVRLGIFHDGHIDFLSPAIPVAIVEEHAEPEGLVLRRGGIDVLSVWQGVVSGRLEAWVDTDGEPLDVVFLDADSAEFVPDEPEFLLVVQIGDTLLVTQSLTADWAFRLRGVAPGTTDVRIGIYHVDHVDFLSPAAPVFVYQSADAGRQARITDLVLQPAAPNPFRGSTRIGFALPRASEVDLSVFDLGGRRVARLVEGSRPAGTHAVEWRPESLPGGIYFVRLSTPDRSTSRRVQLVR